MRAVFQFLHGRVDGLADGRDLALLPDFLQLREQELQSIQDVDLEIDRTILDVAESESAVAVATESIAAATENLRIITERFKAGKVTAREVLEAQRTLTNARFQLNRARFLQRTLLARLESLSGVAASDWPAAP